ncbi:ferredoxin--nitrite reductase [Natronomonas gomsonensis]|uniref:nitrite/sulfite reductase n=1 Tax=Natronomonas gomsonensis TaxID=1046043 RepID=UPI0020CA98E2|nr:ferredoxin--nitrite reductase [Natronomonas gomsonensis]MCY4729831.1 ferredoxin--nitrite reductase [Natronomonas gomsonensis]
MHSKEEYKSDCYGDEVREKILEFAATGFESIPDEEKAAWFSRFKFWGLFHQRDGQESYFMMRLTNANGVLEPGQLRAIAEVARDYATGPVENPEFGNGYIDLTTRQSIQLHWLKLDDVPEIWEKLESVGVTSRSAGGDTMRNITGCPLAGKGEEYVETQPLLDRFQEELRGDDELANMPRKFNISATGCHEGCAQDSINDIGLEPAEKDGERGFNVRVGGGLGGRQPRRARALDIFVSDDEEAYEVVRAFVELYFEEGNRQNRNKNRARFFVDEHGTDWIRDRLEERVGPLESAGDDFREKYTYNAGLPADAGRADHVGVGEQADGNKYVGLSVAVGRLSAQDAIELADLAFEYGSGEIRLTRRQNPLIVDVPEGKLHALLEEPLLDKHAPEPNPFQRGAIACTGTEFCSLALTETKARMARTLRWLRDNVELPDDVEHIHMHFSGCTADCGQAMTADIGLQGMRARKDGEMVEAVDIGVGGGIGEEPTFVEWVNQRVPADEMPGAIKNLVEAFAAHREEGQSFRQWVDQMGTEPIVEFCEGEETDYVDPCLYDAKQSWYPFGEEEEAPTPTAEAASDD